MYITGGLRHDKSVSQKNEVLDRVKNRSPIIRSSCVHHFVFENHFSERNTDVPTPIQYNLSLDISQVDFAIMR